ncbi:MAG: hypothetical protein R3C31_09295 [Hyphomonadaceae bacterium]
MKHLPPLLTETRVEAFTASALRFVCWVFGLIARWGFTGQSRKLRDVICTAERAVERTLFLHAVARLGPLPSRKPRPASAPRGFRVKRSRGQLFYKRANIRARKAHIIDRVFALLDALQNPERAIAYFLKRVRKGLRGRRLVIAAPVTEAVLSAQIPAPLTLDTS